MKTITGDSAETGTNAAVFCGSCGARSHGTRFCEHCGAELPPAVPDAAATGSQDAGERRDTTGVGQIVAGGVAGGVASAAVDAVSGPAHELSLTPPIGMQLQAQPPAQAQPNPPDSGLQSQPPVYTPSKSRWNRGWVIGGIVVAVILLAGAIIAIVLALTKQQGPTYSQQASQDLQALLLDNQRLAAAVAGLTPGGSTDSVQVALTTTQTETETAQQQIAALNPSSANAALSTQLTAALASETEWLRTASTVLSNPSSPLASQLSGLGLDTQSKVQALGTSITGASHAVFPSSAQIVTYVSAVNASAQANAANTQFSNQVMALLNQSSSGFQEVNSFFQQLQAAASGSYATITVAQAEQQISSIISNRQSLAAAAQALSAPTPQSKSVDALLVTAFNDSLKNDNDLANCLNQANNGSEAYIFQSCLDSTSGDSSTATSDKQAFLNAFNQLRASVGQPSVSPQF